jgi:hypothetical protein
VILSAIKQNGEPMKLTLIAMIFAAVPAMAISPNGEDQEQPEVDYISWCDGNSVIGQDSKGQLYVAANCTDSGLKCKATQIYRVKRSIVSAACVQN